MLYKEIIERCKQYHEKYPDYDEAYNDYFKIRNSSKRDNLDMPGRQEVEKLVQFLDDWDCFPGENAEKNKRTVTAKLPRVLPKAVSRLNPLKAKVRSVLTLQKCDREVIRDVYMELAKTPQVGDTIASKILHTVDPEIFVMWDSPIKKKYAKKYAKNSKSAEFILSVGEFYYSCVFLPTMQRIATKAIKQVMKEEECVSSCDDAIRWFTGNCKYSNSLAKIIDEYNFVISR